MTLKRWFFRMENEEEGRNSVYLYETANNDCAKASLIKMPKSKEEHLGPVVKIETTEGKPAKVVDKYGSVHGILVSIINDRKWTNSIVDSLSLCFSYERVP